MEFRVGQYVKIKDTIFYIEEVQRHYLQVRNEKFNFKILKGNVIVDEETNMLDIIKQRENKLKRILDESSI
jgi:methyl coenzyme M reductase subunit D